jgi:leishmanolysin
MLRVLFSFLLVSPLCLSSSCGGVTTHSISLPQPKDQNSKSRSSTAQSIRITPYYTTISLPANFLPSFNHDLMGGVLSWFSNVLSIQQLIHPLDISPLANTNCGSFFINATATNLTYSDTDFLVFVDVSQTSSDNYGYAEVCGQDADLNFPLVGFIHIESSALQTYSYEQVFAGVAHQIAHILAFNSEYFGQYLDNSGIEHGYENVVVSDYERNHTVNKVKTTAVVQHARQEFSCSDIDGVELEDQGTTGVTLNHWEKRIMNNDFMVADLAITDIVYSSITLALFEDSGWYTVNYLYTDDIQWGSKAGCPFLFEKCILNQVATSSFFNTANYTAQCDNTRLNKGHTNLIYYQSPIPSYDQYLGDAYTGGDYYADYCPYVQFSLDGNCRGLGPEQTSVNSDYGESIGSDSRCFEGNYSLSGNSLWHVGCHKVVCFDTYVDVYLGDQAVSCPFTGGFVGLPGYQGFVNCYLSQDVCRQKPCPNACSGLGICEGGVCQCFNGTVGGDCRMFSFEPGNGNSFGRIIMGGAILVINLI